MARFMHWYSVNAALGEHSGHATLIPSEPDG